MAIQQDRKTEGEAPDKITYMGKNKRSSSIILSRVTPIRIPRKKIIPVKKLTCKPDIASK